MSSATATESRLDRLVTILETGSTPFVRNTAADQLSDLAKQHPHDILNLISRVYPFIFHKKWETRISAAKAFGGIISHISLWDPNNNDDNDNNSNDNENEKDNSNDNEYNKIKKEEDLELDLDDETQLKKILDTDQYEKMLVSFADWNLKEVLDSGFTLLSTNDDHFNTFKSIPSNDGNIRNFKSNHLTKKLGYDSLINDYNNIKNEQIEKENKVHIKSEDSSDFKKKNPKSDSPKISARMRALAKRKAKLGNNNNNHSNSNNIDISKSTISDDLSRNSEINSNITAKNQKSNEIDITSQQNGSKLVIENKPLQETVSSFAQFADYIWILQGVYELLIKSLFSPNWEIRHGATLALREIMKFKTLALSVGRVAGKSKFENDSRNSRTLEDLVVRILAILSTDRFGDYVSDTVVAPVRENAAQILAAVLRWIDNSTTTLIFNALGSLIKQENIDKQCWEAKHGGLLGLRYFVSIKPEFISNDQQLLNDTANIVINCLRGDVNDLDRDDDVQTVAASILLPITSQFVELCPNLVKELLYVLWGCLVDLKDDLAAATGSVMDLLGKLCKEKTVFIILQEMTNDQQDANWDFSKLVPRLYPFLRHSLTGVRKSVLNTLLSFINIPDLNMHKWIDDHILRLIFQNLLFEKNEEILKLSETVYNSLIDHLINDSIEIDSLFMKHFYPLLDLLITPIGLPRFNYSMNPENILRSSGQKMSLSDIQLTGINYKKNSSSISYSNNNVSKGNKKKRSIDGNVNPAKSESTNGNSGIPSAAYDLHVNIDAPIINCDVTLIPLETIYNTRMIASKAMGRTIAKFSTDDNIIKVFEQIKVCLVSNFSTSRLISSWIINNFFMFIIKEGETENVNYRKLSEFINPLLFDMLSDSTHSNLPFFREIVPLLRKVRSNSSYLINSFRDQVNLSSSKLKNIAILVSGEPDAGPGAFTINDAKDLVNDWYEKTYKSLNATNRISFGKNLENARDRVKNSIIEVEDEHNNKINSVISSIAGAYIHSLNFVDEGKLPNKLNPIIRSLMDGIKLTDSIVIQDFISYDVAYLVNKLIIENRNNIAEKMVKNLCGFLCVDPAEVPPYLPNKNYDGILSLIREGRDANMIDEVTIAKKKADDKNDIQIIDYEIKGAIIKRRGGKVTLKVLIEMFQNDIFNKLPNLKKMMLLPLSEIDKQTTDKEGQNIIDSFELIKTCFPWLTSINRDEILSQISLIIEGLKSNESVFRYSASKCIASIIDSCPTIGFQFLVEKIMPMISNPLKLNERQGSVECIYHIVQLMDSKILPYIVFLIVPILGRMSDSNKDIRLISTSTFAQIIKLVPLESGIPNPTDMPESLLKGREKEREFLNQMMDPSKIEPFELPVSIKATLRKYQQEGVNWLYFLNKYHLHGILCDDMGLGKTLQTICIISSDHYLRAKKYEEDGSIENRRLPSLIVCPPSLTGHWEQEFKQYSSFMKVLVYAGPPSVRSNLRIDIENKINDKIDVIVTSYDIVRNDIEFLKTFDFNYCVLDEGHIIKNSKSVLSKCVKEVKSEHRLILSGTPIQNNVVELWSLFDFLMPGFLGTYKQFDTKFAKPIAISRKNKGKKEQERGALVLESLHKQVLPFMLRRLKEDVLGDLPPKIIQDYYCELSNLQKQLYKDFITKQKKTIVKDIEDTTIDNNEEEGVEAKQHVFQVLQYMRKLCNHPSLVLTPKHPQFEEVLNYLKRYNMELDDIEHAPKLLALKNLLKECGIGLIGNESTVISQHRALVFCQMKDMLNIVENDLLKKHMPNVTYLRMDGSTDPRYRQNIVKKFNEDPSIDLLLLTTKVGGLGLNLTGADTVIFVEHDWNPMNDLQAMDRAHRLGQKRVVNVYRLITRNTLEEKIMGLQKFKMNIASSIVNQQNSGLASMDTHQLLDLFNSDNVNNNNSNDIGNEEDQGSKRDNNNNGNTGNNNSNVPDEGGLNGVAGKAVKELGELWDEKQYEEEYNLDNFISTLK